LKCSWGNPEVANSFEAPNKSALKKEYDRRTSLYEQLIEEVQYILTRSIKRKKMKIGGMEPRVKEFDSFYDKIIRKEMDSDPFEAIEDIAGIRIICLYRSDLEKIENLIREEFKVIREDLLRKKAMAFGYMTDQYVIKLPKHFRGERYDPIKSLKCEIQVRTASMHAWATVSHHLDYKQEADIPSELKDDFYALSGVFYIADSLFEQFREARARSIRRLKRTITKDQFNFDAELNLDSLRAYLKWRFPERKLYKGEKALSILLSRAGKAEVKNYLQLDDIVNSNMDWFVRDEIEKYRTQHFSAAGIVNRILRKRVLKI